MSAPTRKAMVIAVAIFFAHTSYVSAQVTHNEVGLNVAPQNFDQGAQDLGTGWARIDLSWNWVEASQGTFSFVAADSYLDPIHDSGQSLLLILQNPPTWAANCAVCKPNSLSQWYTYVRTSIEHYYDKYGSAVAFEVWNEPNSSDFFKNTAQGNASVSDYADLVTYAIAARNDSRPAARLAVGAVQNVGVGSNRTYLQNVLGSVSLENQDIVSVHQYLGSPCWGGDFYDAMEDAVSDANGHDVWLTETMGCGQDGNFSEADQFYAVRTILNAFVSSGGGNGGWKKLFFYRYEWTSDSQGLVDSNWAPRLPYLEIQNRVDTWRFELQANQYLGPNECLNSANDLYHLCYQGDGNLVIYHGYTGGAWEATWNAQTDGESAGYFVVQGGGNAVVYNALSQPVWDSQTGDNYQSYLRLRLLPTGLVWMVDRWGNDFELIMDGGYYS